MGVVGVGQQINVEVKRQVADRRDLILRRTSSVQEPRGGKLQLLQSEETQTLYERSFYLRARTTREERKKIKLERGKNRQKGRKGKAPQSFCQCFNTN